MDNFYHYIISAAAAKERREAVVKHFRQQGIQPHLMDAIMGIDLSEEIKQKLVDSRACLKPGAIGCALSHLKVFKEFLKSQEATVCVFEDDVRLTPDFIYEIPKIRKFMGGGKYPRRIGFI